jgi:hypothetical protein
MFRSPSNAKCSIAGLIQAAELTPVPAIAMEWAMWDSDDEEVRIRR